MTTHLTAEQMQAYLVRRVPVDELGKLTEHLHACRMCYGAYLTVLQRRFPIEIDFEELGGLKCWHLEGQELADYVQGRMSALDFDYASLHLKECLGCEQRVDDALRDWVEYEPSTKKRALERHPVPWSEHLQGFLSTSSLRFRIAAALVLVISFALILWAVVRLKGHEAQVAIAPTSEERSPVHSPAKEAAPQKDLHPGATVADDHKTKELAGALPISPRQTTSKVEHEETEEALIAKNLVMPPSIERLDRTPAVAIRGDHPAIESFSIIEPYATLLATERPTFRWTPLNGAQSYTVSVYDEALHLVRTSGPVTGAQWTIPDPLKAGIVYTWTVIALKDGKEITAPAAPRRAEFKVLNKEEMAELQRRIRAAVSRAARGRLYAEAGLLVDAEDEFNRYLSKHPSDERVQKLLQTIKSWRGMDH